MKTENIKIIGTWGIRTLLVLGAIVMGFLGKKDEAGICILGLVTSFILLDSDGENRF